MWMPINLLIGNSVYHKQEFAIEFTEDWLCSVKLLSDVAGGFSLISIK